jgi:hypothetical protein
VKPRMGAQEHRDRPNDTADRSSGSAAAAFAPQLSEDQRQVLDYLKKAGTALTARQLEMKVPATAAAVQDALAGLVDLQLVARLNTLVPSYVYRDPDIKVHVE